MSQTLPTFTRAEVEKHNTPKSTWVTLGFRVFDVTDFAEGHPGGAELVHEYAGKDITAILKDEASHTHTDNAYEILDECLIGFVGTKPANGAANGSAGESSALDHDGNPIHPRTGMSREEDLSRETDYNVDYRTHKFLDLSRPLFPQIFFGGFSRDFYLDQVHRPRHYRGGESAPLFGNFLEPLSKTPWWVVPLIWVPAVAVGTVIAGEGFENKTTLAAHWLGGVALWSFIEYLMHRFLFHLDDYLPDNRYFITLHFLLHGIHHYLPMDKYRLVMPPTLFVALAYPFWHLCHAAIFWSWHAATAIYCGGVFGYILYDLTHYFLHHQNLPLWYKELKKYHLQHHFLDYENGFGVTSRFWDRIFGTELTPVVKAE